MSDDVDYDVPQVGEPEGSRSSNSAAGKYFAPPAYTRLRTEIIDMDASASEGVLPNFLLSSGSFVEVTTTVVSRPGGLPSKRLTMAEKCEGVDIVDYLEMFGLISQPPVVRE